MNKRLMKKRKKGLDNSNILKILNSIKKNDPDNSLFYLWDNLPISIQNKFIAWCERYTQVSHKDCFGGWGFGWSKYHEQYILWLKGKRNVSNEKWEHLCKARKYKKEHRCEAYLVAYLPEN